MRLGRLRRRLTRRFRMRRMSEFARNFQIDSTTKVLDVGGDPWNWSFYREHPAIVVVNVFIPPWVDPTKPDPRFKWVLGDGRRLPFRDRAFDVVFSNAVIEHVGTFEKQAEFAEECRRVGRGYFVQTPNKWFV